MRVLVFVPLRRCVALSPIAAQCSPGWLLDIKRKKIGLALSMPAVPPSCPSIVVAPSQRQCDSPGWLAGTVRVAVAHRHPVVASVRVIDQMFAQHCARRVSPGTVRVAVVVLREVSAC